jgi:autotransporter-associated beta strand protein
VTLQSQGGTIDTNGNNATLSGTISGPGGLTKVGLGTLTLSGSSTYAGATNVNAGTLQAGAVNALSPFSAFTVAGGATLELNNFNQTIGSLAGAGSVMLGSATLTTGNDNTSTTFSGTISGRGGLTKIGAGTLTLSGNNSYSGGTTINAGTLAVSSDSNLGNSSGGLAFGGGTLQFLSGLSTTRGVTLNAGGGTFDTNGNNATLGGPISGAGGLTKIGAGTLTLAGGNSYSGGTALNAGTLAVGSSNALGTGALTFANGTTLQASANGLSLANAMMLNGSDTVDTQANALTLSGTLSSTGALTKIGSGTENTRLLHLAGIALAPSAKPETNSKPLDVFFFGSNLFLADGRFNKPPECQRVKAIRIRR